MNWVTIDFEASCLPQHGRSFPIEVGVCGPTGTSAWLIKPLPAWRQWDWTEEAFGLHRITRDRLDQEGQDPATVVAHVRQAVGEARVIADSRIDRQWWQTLLDASGAEGSGRPLVIEHIGDIFDELGVTDAQIQQAQHHADGLHLPRHRAGSDALWLYSLLSALTGDSDDARPQTFPSWTSRRAYVRGGDQQDAARAAGQPAPGLPDAPGLIRV